MKKFFRKLRAIKPLMVALDSWPYVYGKLLELAEQDSEVKKFREAVDRAWKIIKYGKA